MNKKVLGIVVVVVLLVVIIGGCGLFFGIKAINNKPFRLEEKYYENMSIIDIKHDRYEELVDKKENFILYLTLDGCTSCVVFGSKAVDFVVKNKITVYRIEYKEFSQTDLKDEVKYAPSMMIFKKGKLKAYLDAQSDDDLQYYSDSSSLQTWFEKYIEL